MVLRRKSEKNSLASFVEMLSGTMDHIELAFVRDNTQVDTMVVTTRSVHGYPYWVRDREIDTEKVITWYKFSSATYEQQCRARYACEEIVDALDLRMDPVAMLASTLPYGVFPFRPFLQMLLSLMFPREHLTTQQKDLDSPDVDDKFKVDRPGRQPVFCVSLIHRALRRVFPELEREDWRIDEMNVTEYVHVLEHEHGLVTKVPGYSPLIHKSVC